MLIIILPAAVTALAAVAYLVTALSVPAVFRAKVRRMFALVAVAVAVVSLGATSLLVADKVPGLRGAAFDQAMGSGVHADWAARSEKAFETSGARGTPTVLLDGRPVGPDDALYEAGAFAKGAQGARHRLTPRVLFELVDALLCADAGSHRRRPSG
ncbi:hypothetical protein AB0G73_34725 [Streptomyces sp. NPDC020719]|uniref:DsbA family protein n=1 Tax=Streptomyces sp. NPDC020719 TaxID=3154896 RepID=UPI0033D82C82